MFHSKGNLDTKQVTTSNINTGKKGASVLSVDPKLVPIIRLQGLLSTLNPVEHRLAVYILNNADEVIHSTIEELALRSNSSYATISRFCKKLDYSGFKDFKAHLIQDVIHRNTTKEDTDSTPLDQDTTTTNIISRVFHSSHQVLTETESILEIGLIEQAAETMITSKRIIFIGAGTSGISAKYAFSRFFRLGIPCSTETDPVLYTMEAKLLNSETVLFVVSSSGRTKNVVDAARSAKKCGAKIISLCDYAISPLSEISDTNLCTTPRNVDFFKDLEMPLLTGQITLIDILFSVASLRIPKSSLEKYKLTKDAADNLKI